MYLGKSKEKKMICYTEDEIKKAVKSLKETVRKDFYKGSKNKVKFLYWEIRIPQKDDSIDYPVLTVSYLDPNGTPMYSNMAI
jgi:hypothetical protein